MLGPVLGALLLAVTSPWIAFAANGMTFAVSALLIGSIAAIADRLESARRVTAGSGSDASRGVGPRRSSRLFCVVAMVELTYGAQTVQLVVYARRSLGLGAGGYGDLLAAIGVGGLISAVISGRLATHRRVSVVAIVAALGDVPDPIRLRGTARWSTGDRRAAIGGLGLCSPARW